MAVNGYAAAQDVADLKVATAALATAMGARVNSNETAVAQAAADASAATADAESALNAANARVPFTTLLAGTGSLVGVKSQGVGAILRTLLGKLDDLPVTPEDFGAVGDGTTDDSDAVQAAHDWASTYPTVSRCREVLYLQVYKTTRTIYKRAYSGVRGIGPARSGLKPTMSSGPAMDFDAVGDVSSGFHDVISDFRIDGTNCTGSAYPVRVQGQKHMTMSHVNFWNYNTTSYALQVLGHNYNIRFLECYWHNCKLPVKVAATDVGAAKFPTNIIFRNMFLDNTATTTEPAVLVEDSNGVMFQGRTQCQSVRAKTVIQLKGGPTRATTHGHRIESLYIEDCGGGQSGAISVDIVGQAGNKVDCVIIDQMDVHGAAPNGGHIKATYTDRLTVKNVAVDPAHTMVVDGGNNTNYDIDARFVGACALQTLDYTLSRIVFRASEAQDHSSGFLNPGVAKNSTGVFDVIITKGITNAVYTLAASKDGDKFRRTSAYMLNSTTLRITVADPSTGASTDDFDRCTVTIMGHIL